MSFDSMTMHLEFIVSTRAMTAADISTPMAKAGLSKAHVNTEIELS